MPDPVGGGQSFHGSGFCILVSELDNTVCSQSTEGKLKYLTVWLLFSATSLGFREIGLRPWASRTWTEMKADKHI